MNKVQKTKKNQQQYRPFDDHRGLQIEDFHGEDPQKAFISLDKMADIIANSNWKDSDSLTWLVNAYRDALKIGNQNLALCEFWRVASILRDAKCITTEMWACLESAYKPGGDMKMAKILVKANPDMIHLPFIADKLAETIRGVKYGDAIKKEDGTSDVNDYRNEWNDFLPLRTGGDFPFDNQDYIKGLYRLAMDTSEASPRGHRGSSSMPTKEDIMKVVAEKIGGISAHTLNQRVKIKTGRGRIKK